MSERSKRSSKRRPEATTVPVDAMVYVMVLRKIPRQGYQFAECMVPSSTVVGLLDDDPNSYVDQPELLNIALARWETRFHRRLRNGGM